MWDLPGPGLEPVSPALAGGFSTTAPPGKVPLALNQKLEMKLSEEGMLKARRGLKLGPLYQPNKLVSQGVKAKEKFLKI